MKKYIVFLLGCMLLTFAGCRNDEPVIDNNNPPEVEFLVGLKQGSLGYLTMFL